MKSRDDYFMARAFELAAQAGPKVLPNPRVGAVVVKKNKIVGEGWHQYYGGLHAEPQALHRAGSQARGATLYCTLEPCSHQGKQPPCVNAVIGAGVRRVVLASRDPNPVVSGAKILRRAGIKVEFKTSKKRCEKLNPGFYSQWSLKKPYLHLKVATSLDGFMAPSHGQSQWLTGKESRRQTHLLRSRYPAILTGVGTVLADDPRLNVRYGFGSLPVRLILDSQLRLNPRARILQTSGGPVHIFTTQKSSKRKRNLLEKQGARLHLVRSSRAQQSKSCDLKDVFEICLQQGWSEIYAEPGPTLSTSLLREGWIRELSWFQGPKILGQGLGFDGLGIKNLKSALHLKDISHQILGDDVLWHGFL